MLQFIKSTFVVCFWAVLMAGCSGKTSPDYRADEQRQGAEKAQKELSREMKKRY